MDERNFPNLNTFSGHDNSHFKHLIPLQRSVLTVALPFSILRAHSGHDLVTCLAVVAIFKNRSKC